MPLSSVKVDIVDRLRTTPRYPEPGREPLIEAAAAEIERLRAENEQLRQQLTTVRMLLENIKRTS